MMHFDPVKEHPDWQTKGSLPGLAWLKAHPNAERPYDYWTGKDRKFRCYLRDGFKQLCAYTALWTPNGTVDHFIPWETIRGTAQAHMAYEWSNFRYAAGWFNSSRQSTDIPDPCIVQDDWFELLLPSCELVATAQVPSQHQQAAQNVLRWLGTDDRVIDVRTGYFIAYRSKEITLKRLHKWTPLIARALELPKNHYLLHPADLRRLQRRSNPV